MGRHSIDEAASLRRVELLEAYVASLQASFEALKAKVEEAAAAKSAKFDALESSLANQMDALTQFVHDNFVADADPTPAEQPVEAAPEAPAEQSAAPATWPAQS